MQNIIGIRQENKDVTEKRAPLTPAQVREIITEFDIQVKVESAPNRIFSNHEYEKAGAVISDDFGDCNIIWGVKEIPLESLLPGQTYCYFSHTIKGQDYNMPMLKRLLDLRCNLFDYEKVIDDHGRRLIFFGRFAGYAGMIDTLWAAGKRYTSEGVSSPFAAAQQALSYPSLAEARKSLMQIGEEIEVDGLPETMVPFICGFTGYGQVSLGAQEIYDLLPVQEIAASDLDEFMEKGVFSNHTVYKVVFHEKDMFSPIEKDAAFDLREYFTHPERYKSIFENYLPYLNLVVNGIYWEPRYPKLITRSYLKKAFGRSEKPSLRVIGDITCDIEGSVECNLKATNSKNPVYVYDTEVDRAVDGWEGHGPVVLAVDKLPSELPREASENFGDSLLPFIPALADADFTVPYGELNIPDEFKRALIVYHGRLTPPFRYLEEFLKSVHG